MDGERTEMGVRPCAFCDVPLPPRTWFCPNCGGPAIAAGAIAGGPPPFPVLPGYTVLAEIGVGGSSVVYRARQDVLDREVAVKLLRQVDDASAWRRFEREARIIASLSGHPHVVTIYDVGRTAAGQPFLVTELLERGSVADSLARSGSVGRRAALDIGCAMASALSAAHERDILHRDLKPANVLLGSRGEIKLADFGVARLMAGQSASTTGTIACTPEHAAPEVLRGDAEGTATDVYGLASTLAAALLGRSLFVQAPDERIEALMWRKLSESPVLPDSIDRDIAALLSRCLAIDPAQRPSLETIATELERLHLAASPALPTSVAPRTGAPVVRPTAATASSARPAPLVVGPVIHDTGPTDVPDEHIPERAGGVRWLAAIAAAVALIGGAFVLLQRDDGDQVADAPTTSAVTDTADAGTPATAAPLPSVVESPATEASAAVPSPTEGPATTPAVTAAAPTDPPPTPPAAPPPSATPATTAPPVAVFPPAPAPGIDSDTIDADEAIGFLLGYYDDVAQGNFEVTWPLLSEEFRNERTLTFEDYVGYWRSNSIDVSNLSFTAGPGADVGRIRFDARYTSADGGVVEEVDEVTVRRQADGSLIITSQRRVG